MPNHVRNIVTFTGTKEAVYKLRTETEGDSQEPVIDFNKIVPMPDSIRNTTSGNEAQKAKELVDKALKEEIGKEVALEYLHEFLSGDLGKYIKNYLEYGFTDWYGWSCKHWGTKWNAYQQAENSSDQIEFNTAWSTPYQVMQKLSEKYPDVEIRVEYADEDLGANCGYYVLENGIITDEQGYDDDYDKGLQFACDVWGYDYDELMEQRKEE